MIKNLDFCISDELDSVYLVIYEVCAYERRYNDRRSSFGFFSSKESAESKIKFLKHEESVSRWFDGFSIIEHIIQD